jgi:aminoglycoside 2'-N-acetyltransferase I
MIHINQEDRRHQSPNLSIQVVQASEISSNLKAAIHTLCNRAYDEDLTSLFASFTEPVHVLGFLNGRLASHAMWVTRWLQVGNDPLLRAAYIEMVATEPALQGRGFATEIMRRVAGEIAAYDLGALCPAETSMYARLGWVFWRGPLFIRSGEQLIATSEERIMVLPLPKTPALDLDQAISAEWRDGEVW